MKKHGSMFEGPNRHERRKQNKLDEREWIARQKKMLEEEIEKLKVSIAKAKDKSRE